MHSASNFPARKDSMVWLYLQESVIQAGKGRPCDCMSKGNTGSGEKSKAGAEEGLSVKDGQRCSDEMTGEELGWVGRCWGVRESQAQEDFTSLGSPGGAAGDAGLRKVGLRGTRATEGSGSWGWTGGSGWTRVSTW